MTYEPPRLRTSVKAVYIVAMIASVVSLFVFFKFLWAVFMPVQLTEVETPMPLANGVEYHRGDTLHFIINYKKHNDYPAVGTRTIQCDDGNLVTMTEVRTNLPSGEGTSVSLPLVIPEKVSDGWCKLVIDVRFEINGFRNEQATYETVPFYVFSEEE